jgi:hypothetical protein
VGVVHSLQRDARVIAVEVAILDEILDGFDDLAVLDARRKRQIHMYYLLEGVCLFEACFQHWLDISGIL